MGTSSIVPTALTATPSLRGNKLAVALSIDGPSANLPNLQIDTVEFWASTTNDRSTASLVVSGYPEAVHAGLIEEQTYYYWAKAKNRSGDYGAFYPSSATNGVSCTAIGISGLAFGLANGKLTATAAASSLTVAIKTAAGNDPSAADPVFIAFQNSDLSIGNYVIRQLSAALSVTISAGSTLGTNASPNNTPFRIWVVIFDDNGTLKLGVFNASIGATGSIYPLAETSQAAYVGVDDGSGGADSSGRFYTNTSLTKKIYRTVGYLEYTSGLATPGTWASSPNVIRLAGRGVPLPGGIIQDVSNFGFVHGGTNSVAIPFDDTIPQNTEGRSEFVLALTPASPCNFFEIEGLTNIGCSSAAEFIAALFQDSGANALQAQWDYAPTANEPIAMRYRFRLQAATSIERTYEVRVGPSTGTVTLGGVSGSGKIGGVLTDFYQIKELQG